MSPADGYRYVHRWFVLQLGEELASELEGRMTEALPADAPPIVPGLVADLRPSLLYAHQLAFGVDHRGAVDLWIGQGAVGLIEALWPVVFVPGWPEPGLAVRGVREGWLRRLDDAAAEAMRLELEERTEGAWARVEPETLAAALAEDTVDVGEALAALGDRRGEAVREAGQRLLAHLDDCEPRRQRWAPVAAALAAGRRRNPEQGGMHE